MDDLLRWLRNAVITAAVICRQSVVSLRYNWGIGLLSVVLAVSLWVYVTDRENPERTVRVPGTVAVEAVNVPSGQAVFPPLEESVTVRVRGPESVVDGLRAEDFRATVNLSDVRVEAATVNVQVEPTERRVEVVEISPAQVTVHLESLTSRSVPVRTHLVGAPPRGFEAQELTVQPEETVVTGPESLVRRVDSVEADVNLTGVRTDFQETLLLKARDVQGGNIQGVNVAPESVVVRVEIVQLEFSAPFVVRPDVSGAPAEGFNAAAIRVEPAFVVVSGPSDVFASIDPVQGISTDPVSIEGASADVVRTVALRLPEGATVAQAAVTVRVTITATQGTFSFTVALQTANTPSGLSATLAQGAVQVVLSGALRDLNAVTPEQIAATVDLNGLEAGEHELPVAVQAPAGASVVSITPARVRVTLRPS